MHLVRTTYGVEEGADLSVSVEVDDEGNRVIALTETSDFGSTTVLIPPHEVTRIAVALLDAKKQSSHLELIAVGDGEE